MEDSILIVGLGNPGKEYEQTCHNIGWGVLGKIMEEENENWKNTRNIKGKTCKFNWRGKDIIFLLPSTFMNKSGQAVQSAAKYWKIKPENIIVIHDDSDIELESVKVSFNQSSGGHKGVKDIISKLKTKKFGRLKIGVRPNLPFKVKRPKAETFILKEIPTSQKEEIIRTGKDALETWVEKGIDEAMNRYN